MNIDNQLNEIKKLHDRYKEERIDRSFTEPLVKVFDDEKTYAFSIVTKDIGITYIVGNTLDPNFWIGIRNNHVSIDNNNDDFQKDDTCYELQKSLLDHGIYGEICLALIGVDATDEDLLEYGKQSLKDQFIPIYWCWCHDWWVIKQLPLEYLRKQIKKEEIIYQNYPINIPSC